MQTTTPKKFNVRDTVLELKCLYSEASDQIGLIKEGKANESLRPAKIIRVRVGAMTFQTFRDIYGKEQLEKDFDVHMGWDTKTHDYAIEYSDKPSYRVGNHCR